MRGYRPVKAISPSDIGALPALGRTVPERASCWSSLPLPLTSLPGHIPPGQTTLRPRRKSSINLQASQLQKSHLHPPACSHVLGSALPWCPGYASTRLAPASPSYVTSTGPDWVADAEIRPRRGKPPKPGSYTAWFPWQPSHSRQTVQGGGQGGGNSSSRHSQGWLRPQFSCWRNFSL